MFKINIIYNIFISKKLNFDSNYFNLKLKPSILLLERTYFFYKFLIFCNCFDFYYRFSDEKKEFFKNKFEFNEVLNF
jgi:hypothetical protein